MVTSLLQGCSDSAGRVRAGRPPAGEADSAGEFDTACGRTRPTPGRTAWMSVPVPTAAGYADRGR